MSLLDRKGEYQEIINYMESQIADKSREIEGLKAKIAWCISVIAEQALREPGRGEK